ncbi:unnamed protein product [Rotaria magnacalcarata]|uniref:Protein phosphatase methylesterase 1 n=2 Tax=Rotaria magnacalcarata TaxID=392030 RepID=A0A816VAP3_9BILA|nr:unnamed protein product [Rotaria magnacalcarata]CAF2117664.1 unnamed protein product [Rotaria magnacalcarata]CAF3900291.1 unnamed protein product [Rotaria magnacalcarata]CAF4174421.1 unnamed protein product [Rotaria magnacalcarata]
MSNLRKQMLSKSLPPIGPSSSKKLLSYNENKSSSIRNYAPIEWNTYFNDKRFITIEKNTFCVYSRTIPDSSAPILFFLHGGGFSGLSWALMSKAVTNLVRCQCIAVDIRGHGETKTTDESDLSIETLTNDICQILHYLFNEENKTPIFLIGHSMGGALAVHVAKQNATLIDALCVIDVVEGSALESLNSMQCFLSSRPKQFSTPEQAVEYMVRSGQVRNVESARVSVIGQIQPMINIQSNEEISSTAAAAASNSTLPEVSHLCETVREEDEEQEQDNNDNHNSSIDTQKPTSSNVSNEINKYTWRIDLSKTEKFWKGWFSGLSKLFLSCECPKLLLLAGVDRLDRDLTVGQMQGKFQMHVVPKSGHAVHEDAPEQVADCIASFLVRHKLVQPNDDSFQGTLPGC